MPGGRIRDTGPAVGTPSPRPPRTPRPPRLMEPQYPHKPLLSDNESLRMPRSNNPSHVSHSVLWKRPMVTIHPSAGQSRTPRPREAAKPEPVGWNRTSVSRVLSGCPATGRYRNWGEHRGRTRTFADTERLARPVHHAHHQACARTGVSTCSTNTDIRGCNSPLLPIGSLPTGSRHELAPGEGIEPSSGVLEAPLTTASPRHMASGPGFEPGTMRLTVSFPCQRGPPEIGAS